MWVLIPETDRNCQISRLLTEHLVSQVRFISMKLLWPGSELRVLSSPMNHMGAGVSAVDWPS